MKPFLDTASFEFGYPRKEILDYLATLRDKIPSPEKIKIVYLSILLCYNLSCGAKSRLFGGIAQLGEHLLHTQGVTGSSPAVSTKKTAFRSGFFGVFIFYGQKKGSAASSHAGLGKLSIL